MATPSFTGDLLVHNNEPCDASRPFEGGLSLWNVTDPRAPAKLAGGVGDATPAISRSDGHASAASCGRITARRGRPLASGGA
jgi:hypothetical protein